MVKKTKGKHRLDKFYHLAKEQGYRSRAAFKLIQLNRQFHFLDKARACLDLCAAPGGWMQVAVKTMPLNSVVVGIDLDPIKAIKGARSIVGDITTAKARAAIKKESNGAMMEVVLHDGAPNVGGVWTSEAYSQSALVLEALKLATDVLVPQGVFVTKIFRSQDYNALLFAFKQLFRKVEATKPAASRNTSAEIFVVCEGYKAPAKIDPRLLDPKHLFQEVTEAPKNMGPDALLKMKMKQKRFREGYEEGLSSLHKQSSAAAFIASSSPVEMLGQFTRFVLEDGSSEGDEQLAEITKFTAAHTSTNGEIKSLLADLQVLGRSEFKMLLKWRLGIKKDLALSSGKSKDQEAAVEPEEEKDPELALMEEMQDVRERASQRQRREKKRRLEAKKKSRLRAAQLAKSEGIAEEDAGDAPLFSLTDFKGTVRASEIGQDTAVPDEEEAAIDSDDLPESDFSDSDVSDEERGRRYEAQREEALEAAYSKYLERRGQREKAARAKRARLGRTGELGSDADSDLEGDDSQITVPQPALEEEPEVGGGLLVTLDEGAGRAKTAASVAAQWFSQDLFTDANCEQLSAAAVTEERKLPGRVDEGKLLKPPPSTRDAKGIHSPQVPEVDRQDASHPDKGKSFEEVPASDSGSDSELEEPDEQTAAELRAFGKAMLNGRRRNDIIEAAYHRYAFHDDALPRWFVEDEELHMRAPIVISQEEVVAEKERLRAIDSRPIKKVAEAKARKKKRLQVRIEQARSKASNILEQGDLSEQAKVREVEKLYSKAKGGSKSTKKKPTRSDKYKKRKGPPLDRRLLSDKRQFQHKSKAKAAKARRKGGAKNKGKAR